jgi:hypothetical protein
MSYWTLSCKFHCWYGGSTWEKCPNWLGWSHWFSMPYGPIPCISYIRCHLQFHHYNFYDIHREWHRYNVCVCCRSLCGLVLIRKLLRVCLVFKMVLILQPFAIRFNFSEISFTHAKRLLVLLSGDCYPWNYWQNRRNLGDKTNEPKIMSQVTNFCSFCSLHLIYTSSS